MTGGKVPLTPCFPLKFHQFNFLFSLLSEEIGFSTSVTVVATCSDGYSGQGFSEFDH